MKKISLAVSSSLFALLLSTSAMRPGFAAHDAAVSGPFTVLKTETKTQFGKTNTAATSGSNQTFETYELTNGSALIEPHTTVKVQLKNCSITAHSGCALLLSMNDGVGSVTNLSEGADRSTEVVFGNSSLKLGAGRQVWFGATEDAVANAVKDEPGRPTLVRQQQTPVGIIAEFSISPITMMDTIPSVHLMRESKVSAERKLFDRIVKTSAALTMAQSR